MPTTNYVHVNGVKIAQIKDGVRTDYLTDALGSVTATKNQSQQIVNTYRYKPYGKLLARTGLGDDPRYLWTGNTGSRVTQTRNVNQFNVHRHYANGPAVWTSVDPLWPDEWGFVYCFGNPISQIDPSDRSCADFCCCCPDSISLKSQRQILRVAVYAPPVGWLPSYNLYDFSGMELVFEFRWKKYVEGKSDKMPPCNLSWDEYHSDDNGYVRHFNSSLAQWKYWRNCHSTEPCKDGMCLVLDSPGVAAFKPNQYGGTLQYYIDRVRKTGKPEYSDVCMRMTLQRSCLQPGQCQKDLVTKTFFFQHEIQAPFVNERTSIRMSISEVSSCTPRRNIRP